MTNKTFEPMGLVDITREITKLNRNRKRLDDMTDRLQSALDAKRDLQGQVASDYSRQLQDTIKHNDAMWKSGYEVGMENGLRKGYDEGYKAGRESEMQKQIDSMTLDEVSQELVSGGISVEDQDQLVDDVAKMIEDKDEDEPDQYQPETEKWGGTK